MQNDDVTMLLWAKSSASGGHPLIQHLLDVAAVAHEWALLLPEPVLTRLAGSFQIATHDVPAWAAAICGLHDLGKATPGFQAKWAPGQQRAAAGGFDFPRGAPDRHDAATAYLLPRVLRARG
jgi:CRISPR-associated endonuclease/helicase Cas3